MLSHNPRSKEFTTGTIAATNNVAVTNFHLRDLA